MASALTKLLDKYEAHHELVRASIKKSEQLAETLVLAALKSQGMKYGDTLEIPYRHRGSDWTTWEVNAARYNPKSGIEVRCTRINADGRAGCTHRNIGIKTFMLGISERSKKG